VQGFFDFMKSLGAARMAAMAAVTLALFGFFSFLMIQMTTPQMVPLFTDLSVDDSASIIKDLERQAIPYQLKSDGAITMPPKDKVARLRMKLAESGLPKGGGVGYEIFDKTDSLGTTTFVQNINHLRASSDPARFSNLIAKSARRSTSTSTIGWLPAAKWCLSRTSSG
jgi:flagellar M-ring protein FliF